MILPESIKLREVFHGHGAKGMATYGYADIDKLGVGMTAKRKTGRHPFIEAWTFEWLPDQTFPNYERLREILARMPDEQIDAERAKWPVVDVEPEACGNRCRLCPKESKKPSVVWVTVRRSWTILNSSMAPLCEEHRLLANDPPVLLAALAAEVAERRASAAARERS